MNEYYSKFDIFKKNISTLKETSLDNDSGLNMTQSLMSVVNFDGVKGSYIKGMELSLIPCSNDALYIDEKGGCYFIEFKNGKMDNREVYNIHYKIYDSLLIFTDIIGEGITFCRENVDFILVYNEGKNDKEVSNMHKMQEESSRVKIAKHFCKKAKKPFIRFNLERFQKLYFRRVLTYTEKEFEEEFVNCCNTY